MCHSLWQGHYTRNREHAGGKQVVNRLKIPQGLSTLSFRRWSEVPSRGVGGGGGSAVIHRKKNIKKDEEEDLLYKDAICLCHSLWQ